MELHLQSRKLRSGCRVLDVDICSHRQDIHNRTVLLKTWLRQSKQLSVELAKSATFDDLEKSIDDMVSQYHNAVHATNKHNPAMLFKQRNLQSSLHCINTSDVTFYKGNDLAKQCPNDMPKQCHCTLSTG